MSEETVKENKGKFKFGDERISQSAKLHCYKRLNFRKKKKKHKTSSNIIN